MSINGIGAGGGYAGQGVALDAEGQLALLLLEKEESQQEVDRQSKELARADFIEDSAAQVAAMHEEADHIALGAYFQAAASLTAAGIQVGDELMEPECDPLTGRLEREKPWGEVGAGAAGALSMPLGKLLGDSPAAHDRAEAKQAGTLAEQDEWRLSDAKEAIHDSDQRQDKVLAWLSSTEENRASTSAAIIAGLA